MLRKVADHANVHNHFSIERHLVDKETYKTLRASALAALQNLMV